MSTLFPGQDMDSYDVLPANWMTSLETIAPGSVSLTQNAQATGEAWYESLARLLPTLAATYQQKQLLQIQVDRARQGLPPLNASQYGAGFNIGLSQDTQNMILIGGLALLGVFLLTRKRRK